MCCKKVGDGAAAVGPCRVGDLGVGVQSLIGFGMSHLCLNDRNWNTGGDFQSSEGASEFPTVSVVQVDLAADAFHFIVVLRFGEGEITGI